MSKNKNSKEFEISISAIGESVKQFFKKVDKFCNEVQKHKIVVTFEKVK